MIKAKISLYIINLNKVTLNYNLLSIKDNKIEVPSYEIQSQGENLTTIIENLFEKYVKLSSRFIPVILTDAEIIEDELRLIYHCLVPYNVEIQDSYFKEIDVKTIYSKNLRKIIQSL